MRNNSYLKGVHTVAGALLMGMAAGEFRVSRGPTDANRRHAERAPAGSAAEAARIEAAERRRRHRAAKRARHAGN